MENVISKVSARFNKLFPAWFSCFLALCVMHRLFGVWDYYQGTLRPIYSPNGYFNAIQLWWKIFGESTVLGLRYDVLVSVILAAVVICLVRPVRIVLLVILTIFFAANADHIIYNHSHISFSTVHLGADATFLGGMLTKEFALRVCLLFVIAGLALVVLRIKPLSRIAGFTAVGVIFLALIIPVNSNFSHPAWLQSNPLLGSPFSVRGSVEKRLFPNTVLTPRVPDTEVKSDFNILIVYMEGLSQLSIDAGEMTYLSTLASSNIQFTRYVGPQLITANGLYSSLSGHLPNFLRSDLKWVAGSEDDDFQNSVLPALLKNAGYHTAFLQSAPLDYMDKDEVMPNFGFDVVRGRESWNDVYYSNNTWGFDDLTLFEHTQNYIDTLDPDQPWLVSVLTTGTHAPYNVPDDFLPAANSSRFRALKYLDRAIEELVQGLESRGLLDNTIVVLTSDESRERTFAGGMQSQLALNWLPLIILHPSQKSIHIESYVSAVEMPSVMINLANDHSVNNLDFLEDDSAPIVFGNIYSKRFYWFHPTDRIFLACSTIEFLCAEFENVVDPFLTISDQPVSLASFPNLQALLIEHAL